MNNTIAPPTLEEISCRISQLEALRLRPPVGLKRFHDIELYCLYAVRDGVAASEQFLSEAERQAVEHARWQVRHAHLTNTDCYVDYRIIKQILDVIDRKNPQSPWMDIETAPPIEPGNMQEYVIAVYRKRTNKIHTFACSYLKAYPLHYEDTDFCPNKTCDDGPCSDGCLTTGWFTLVGEDDEAGTYYRLALYDGDKLMGWREMPQWDSVPPTHNSPPVFQNGIGGGQSASDAMRKLSCPTLDHSDSKASHNHGEGDPSVMPDCSGGET